MRQAEQDTQWEAFSGSTLDGLPLPTNPTLANVRFNIATLGFMSIAGCPLQDIVPHGPNRTVNGRAGARLHIGKGMKGDPTMKDVKYGNLDIIGS